MRLLVRHLRRGIAGPDVQNGAVIRGSDTPGGQVEREEGGKHACDDLLGIAGPEVQRGGQFQWGGVKKPRMRFKYVKRQVSWKGPESTKCRKQRHQFHC